MGVESLVSEIEQESDLMWQDADNDLKSRDKAATNIESKVPENNGMLRLLNLCFDVVID